MDPVSVFADDDKFSRRRVVGFRSEMTGLKRWLAAPGAPSQLFYVSGIGGIGKTTLLAEMARAARASSALTLWVDGRGESSSPSALLTSLEAGLRSEYGRTREPERPLLPFVVSELARQPSVVFMDNCETIERMEGWLLAGFLPMLPDADVLLVLASRKELPLKWRANPYWGSRMQAMPLRPFTREEVYDYLRGSGLESSVQANVAEQTDGYPLLLALTVDMLRSREGDALHGIPGMLSAELLREAASPALYDALAALALLPAADQRLLNLLLDEPLDAAGYYALGGLSFVRPTAQGLSLHHVVSRLLREDYARRHPEQYEQLRYRAFKLLARHFREADKRLQMRIAAHVLELYRECLPSAHAYVDFSPLHEPQEYDPFRPEDLPILRRLLTATLARPVWQSELVRPENYAALLEDIAQHSPEGVCVVRDGSGAPLAFCAGFRLHASTMPLLERYAPRMMPILGGESDRLRAVPAEEAESVCVLLAAVDIGQALYRPEELGALLMRQWLIQMTGGWRGILLTADPNLNVLLPVLGFSEIGRVRPETAGAAELTRWELDFRQVTFADWVQTVIRRLEPGRSDRLVGPEGGAEPAISGEEMKDVLLHLFREDGLARLSAVRRLRMPASAVQRLVQELLTAEPPPYPLTEPEQSMLRELYLRKARNKNELAAAFHMSRSTFYRRTQRALDNLAAALGRSIADR